MCCSFYEKAVSVRTGGLLSLEHCRMAETEKNDPGQWKFIGIEGKLNNINFKMYILCKLNNIIMNLTNYNFNYVDYFKVHNLNIFINYCCKICTNKFHFVSHFVQFFN